MGDSTLRGGAHRPSPIALAYLAYFAGLLKGLGQFCADRKVDRGYVITKDVDDFSVMPLVRAAAGARVVKTPAPLACYWLGLLEAEAAGRQ
jgi:hypothetical protein